ncbi:MAG: hypothetical protein ABIK44_06130 [candidate division WOR-3 bacterium]
MRITPLSLILMLIGFGLTVPVCNRPKTSQEIVLPELGFTMKVPRGWLIGWPSLKRTKKYLVSADGEYCFPSVNKSYPFGVVRHFPLGNFGTLAEFVHTPPTLYGALEKAINRPFLGYDAIEVIGFGEGEHRIPVKGLHKYIKKGDQVIVVSFLTTEEEFPEQESIFRASLSTIQLK